MARCSRVRTSLGLLCLVVLSSLAASPNPRVRSTTPKIASLISEAESRSATFRNLVRTIEGTNGIVYVEPGQCRHGVHACLSLSVVSGGGYRLLRIMVDGFGGVIDLMATIGHELRHAVELLSEPSVKTMAAAYNFYLREASTSHGAFETRAAVAAGFAVAHELEHAGR